jgi:hypothetical protein
LIATMNNTTTFQPFDSDARRLALEVMATLAHIKKVAADQLLRPAGVSEDLIRTFLNGRDAATGKALTKRQAGATILEELGRHDKDGAVVRRLVELAANWNSFHLADNEYEARAVVQKARELVGVLATADEREKAEHERAMRARGTSKERQGVHSQATKRVAFSSIRRGFARRERSTASRVSFTGYVESPL